MTHQSIMNTWESYVRGDPMTDEQKDDICDKMGYIRVRSIRWDDDCIWLKTQQRDEYYISTLFLKGGYTREQWRRNLHERGFCPLSIEKILDSMASRHFLRD